MLFPYQSNINTNCLCATEDGVLVEINYLFSRLNYALSLVIKVQVKICSSMIFLKKMEAEPDTT